MIGQNLFWLLIAAVLLGHFGLSIAIYNRVNGFGLPRAVIKGFVYVYFVFTVAFPPLGWHLIQDAIIHRDSGGLHLADVPTPLLIYSIICLASWFVLGIPWLMWRPIFGIDWIRPQRRIEVVDVAQQHGGELALTSKCKFESKLPLNQLFELSIEELELPVRGLPSGLDGYQIAHLSDIHLTGDVHPDFSRYAVERATAWQPDLMALTGDIIDSQPCIDWLPEIFSGARATDGCYYVLGNHDTRIVDSSQTRDAMDRAGWTDLGSRSMKRELANVPSLLIGNEHPWFSRPALDRSDDASFRLLLSHSPDQIGWARKHRVTLMLAGHTHGGQGRLPLVGPILGPSLHGSRYASGDFYKPPTTMHVSRGLCGKHLIRIHCRPELSLLRLRSIPIDADT